MSIALFGGTFDPVHNGHLQMAMELRDALDVSDMRLVPCANPYHREHHVLPAKQRLAMLELALAGKSDLSIDARELDRTGPSYSVDTLADVRQQSTASTPLMLCIGMDALLGLASWHQWQRITELAHIVVVARPDFNPPKTGAVAQLLQQQQTTSAGDLLQSSSGLIHLLELSLVPISATQIRQRVEQGLSITGLVPTAVEHYIQENQLYKGNS